jgi:hypothetical protein
MDNEPASGFSLSIENDRGGSLFRVCTIYSSYTTLGKKGKTVAVPDSEKGIGSSSPPEPSPKLLRE